MSTSDCSRGSLSAVLDGLAGELLVEAEVWAPPIDALVVARRLGIVVVANRSLPVRARCVRLSGTRRGRRGTIVLGAAPRPERRQWATAHEIGELVAHRVYRRWDAAPTSPSPELREQVASAFARALLLPRSWFERDGTACAWDLPALKRIYRTASHELIARRMLAMPPRVVITLFDQAQVRWRRDSRAESAPPFSAAEHAVWNRVRATGVAASQFGASVCARAITCWPVHEANWRREVLRVELAE